MDVMIKRLGGAQKMVNVTTHIKYIGFRDRENENAEIGFFDAHSDNYVDYQEFVNSIKDNKALVHGNSNKIHKFVFSLRACDYNAYKNSGKDIKYLVRTTISEFETKQNIKIDWIAAFHDSEKHPHAHVVMKAVSSEPDKNGKYTRIKFDKDTLKELKECMNNVYERDVVRDHSHDVSRLGVGLMQGITRDIKQKERENEREKKKEVKKKERER